MSKARAAAHSPKYERTPEQQLWLARLSVYATFVVFAVIAHVVAPPSIKGLVRYVIDWDAGALGLLAASLRLVASGDHEKARRRAGAEDPGGGVVVLVILVASAFAMLGAIGILGQPHHYGTHAEDFVVLFAGVLCIATAWAMIHMTLTFRYAHLFYYEDGSVGGLIFPGTDDPKLSDFAYFSFVVGMTFQVSDVQITDRMIRRVALLHGLWSFAFNAVVISVSVNIASGLLHP